MSGVDGADGSAAPAEQTPAAASSHIQHLPPIDLEITFPKTYPMQDPPGRPLYTLTSLPAALPCAAVWRDGRILSTRDAQALFSARLSFSGDLALLQGCVCQQSGLAVSRQRS